MDAVSTGRVVKQMNQMLDVFRYKNIYCAQCHGITEGLQFWRVDIGCYILANDSCRVSNKYTRSTNWNLRQDATVEDLSTR